MRRIETYQLRFAKGILLFFLIGIFHNPILEGLHFLSHLKDYSKNNSSFHSLNTHNGSTHNHLLLNSIQKQINSNQKNLPTQNQKDNQFKNLTQFFYPCSSLNKLLHLQNSNLFMVIWIRSLFDLQTPKPPPRLA